MIANTKTLVNKNKGSSLSLPAYGREGQGQHLSFWQRISQSEIQNSAAAEKSESESEGRQKFLPPNPLPFCPLAKHDYSFQFRTRAKRFARSFLTSFGLPGIEPGLHPPHGCVLPVYYSPL